MVPILLAMLVILALAGVVVLYVAYPHRGEDVPHTPWVGRLLRHGVHRLPTLDNRRSQEDDADTSRGAPREERARVGLHADR